jgi:hypothetical protein
VACRGPSRAPGSDRARPSCWPDKPASNSIRTILNGGCPFELLRNLFDSEDRYNSELQWSFPIKRRLRGLVQYYNGYGENMIDHDHKNQRIAFGILMTDWL